MPNNLSSSERGAKLVRSSIDTVWDTIHRALYVDPASSVVPKFQFLQKVWNNMYVSTVRGMHLNLYPTNVALNSVVNTRLEVRIFQRVEDNSAWFRPRHNHAIRDRIPADIPIRRSSRLGESRQNCDVYKRRTRRSFNQGFRGACPEKDHVENMNSAPLLRVTLT